MSKRERTGFVTQATTYGYDQDNRLRTVAVPVGPPGEAVEQWGATATASSAYGTGTAAWAPSQATGAPNVAGCTSSGQAWAPSSSTPGQWLEVGYAAPAKAVGVRIHETGNAGTVTKVELVDEGGTAHEVWSGTDGTLCGQWLEVKLPETEYRVAKVKLTTKAQTHVDAVSLVSEPAAGPTATVGYEYDANGLRVRKSDAAGVTSYLLDGLSVVGTYDANGARQAWYTQSPARIDEVLNVSNVQGKYWYQADALGSIYALTTAGGAVQARGGYDVFGEPVAQGGTPVGQPFGFTGREHEVDSGLVYARARYLQPGLGRWDRADPAPNAQELDGPNVYVYVGSRVTVRVDPMGLVAVPLAPPGVFINENLVYAVFQRDRIYWDEFRLHWFYQQVRNRGPWDYKQRGRQYEDFGNFNFGATGAALGFSDWILLRGAGCASTRADPNRTSLWGHWWGDPPYGDDPRDQEQIKAGIEYWRENSKRILSANHSGEYCW